MSAYKYDVFLSYAVEDKRELVNELYCKLEQKGLKVWYAAKQLIPGNSIEQTVRDGLKKSRYGIVLITHTYFEKKWTLKELYTLMSQEEDGKKILIPIFHKITPEEVAIHDRLLSERWALQTCNGVDKLSDEIVNRVRLGKEEEKKKWILISAVFLMTLMGLGYCLRSIGSDLKKSDQFHKFQHSGLNQFEHTLSNAKPAKNLTSNTSFNFENGYSIKNCLPQFYPNLTFIYIFDQPITIKQNIDDQIDSMCIINPPRILYQNFSNSLKPFQD